MLSFFIVYFGLGLSLFLFLGLSFGTFYGINFNVTPKQIFLTILKAFVIIFMLPIIFIGLIIASPFIKREKRYE